MIAAASTTARTIHGHAGVPLDVGVRGAAVVEGVEVVAGGLVVGGGAAVGCSVGLVVGGSVGLVVGASVVGGSVADVVVTGSVVAAVVAISSVGDVTAGRGGRAVVGDEELGAAEEVGAAEVVGKVIGPFDPHPAATMALQTSAPAPADSRRAGRRRRVDPARCPSWRRACGIVIPVTSLPPGSDLR